MGGVTNVNNDPVPPSVPVCPDGEPARIVIGSPAMCFEV